MKLSTQTPPGDRITVNEWGDIDTTTQRIDEQQKQVVKSLLNDEIPEGKSIIWLPEFINPESKNLETVGGHDQLAVCTVTDYSEDAWAVTQGDTEPEFVPKDWSVVFDAGEFDEIVSEQSGLSQWSQ